MKTLAKNLLVMVAIMGTLASCRMYDSPWEYDAVIVEEQIPLSDFDGLLIGNGMRVEIKKGPYSIMARGDQNDIADLLAKVDKGDLSIKYNNNRRRYEMYLYISMPDLSYATFSGGAKATINGFNNKHLCIEASGGSDVYVDSDATIFDVASSGGATLEIYGRGSKLFAEVSGGAQLWARQLYVDHADIDLSGGSRARINAAYDIFGEASGASSIKYVGNPKVDVLLSGGSTLARDF
jgi:hypothetical protein